MKRKLMRKERKKRKDFWMTLHKAKCKVFFVPKKRGIKGDGDGEAEGNGEGKGETKGKIIHHF